MMLPAPLECKIATEDWEFERIHELNYKTFVEEIPQHQPTRPGQLVDKFHLENTYVICLSGKQLIAMLAVRGKRPFSLDQKLPQLDRFLPSGRSICEVRLLAVEKNFRMSQVFYALLKYASDYCFKQGYDMAVISGTTRQQKLYKHLGCVPFGPLVSSGDALFQPMYIARESFEANTKDFFAAGAAEGQSG